MRKPLQGLGNVIWFNWPYYLLSAIVVLMLAIAARLSDGWLGTLALITLVVAAFMTLASLLATLYVYDLSGFYKLGWLDEVSVNSGETILNINAGFDETSKLLTSKFPTAKLIACDFYDAARHTEPSIRRARRAYPPFQATITIRTDCLPFEAGSIDTVFAIMSAHEIRDASERSTFIEELDRVLSPTGRIVVVEHLRDAANFFAYNIGALHFHSRLEWVRSFLAADLEIECEKKLSPFVTAFFLKKNGTAS